MYSTTIRFTHRNILSYKKTYQLHPNLPNIETFQEVTLNSQKSAYFQKGGPIHPRTHPSTVKAATTRVDIILRQVLAEGGSVG